MSLPRCLLTVRPLSFAAASCFLVGACASPDQSFFVYRVPYADDSNVKIWQDHTTHSGNEFAVDMAGIDAQTTYSLVAARAGTIRLFRDNQTTNCTPAVGCENNYIWIEHTGNEWTKYSHVVAGSVTAPIAAGGANLSVGSTVSAGQRIGREGNVGMAVGSNNGRHLHFEVREVSNTVSPNPSSLAGDLAGVLKIPRFCGVGGGIAVKGETYAAVPCQP